MSIENSSNDLNFYHCEWTKTRLHTCEISFKGSGYVYCVHLLIARIPTFRSTEDLLSCSALSEGKIIQEERRQFFVAFTAAPWNSTTPRVAELHSIRLLKHCSDFFSLQHPKLHMARIASSAPCITDLDEKQRVST